MFNEGIISQNVASQAANMRKYFYLNLLIYVIQKCWACNFFLGYFFHCQVMLASKFNAMFFLCIMGTEEVHRGTQRFDKGARICYGLVYPHSY